MEVGEIFNKISTHMYEGIMLHNYMIQAYDFLGLYGYSKCHMYHYYEENKNYRQLVHYYTTHYFKIIQMNEIIYPDIIPENWYKYSAQAVDIGTKRNAIKELMTKWISWEKDTKKIYEEMCFELTNLREIAAAIKIQKLIIDVDKELSKAQKDLLNLEAIGYDLTLIVDWQDDLKKQYKGKIKAL